MGDRGRADWTSPEYGPGDRAERGVWRPVEWDLAEEPNMAGPGITLVAKALAWGFVAVMVILFGLAAVWVALLLVAAIDALVHSL